MSTLLRWGKFNLVGAMGAAVQLSALALINRLAPGHYLLATAAAIELTLLHNFMWHLHVTWADRRGEPAVRGRAGGQLLRFHLSNGVVSMLGNLGLMGLLVQHAHAPLVAANCVAILCCSIANFCLGNWWAFGHRHAGAVEEQLVA
jgi:putative flippase GtrA